MYSNNIVNFDESTTILNACKRKSENLLKAPRRACWCAEKNAQHDIKSDTMEFSSKSRGTGNQERNRDHLDRAKAIDCGNEENEFKIRISFSKNYPREKNEFIFSYLMD